MILAIKQKKEESIIALPEDTDQKPFKAVSVVLDPHEEYKHGDVVVVPTHVVQEIEIVDNKFYLVEKLYHGLCGGVMPETVDHPDHYGGQDNTYEAIKIIEAYDLNFSLGNAIKYIIRAGKKKQRH